MGWVQLFEQNRLRGYSGALVDKGSLALSFVGGRLAMGFAIPKNLQEEEIVSLSRPP